MAQHTQLVLTLLHGLCSCDHLHSDLAAELLQMILEGQGTRQEQVRSKAWRAQPLSGGPGGAGEGRWGRWAPRVLLATGSKQPCLRLPEAACPQAGAGLGLGDAPGALLPLSDPGPCFVTALFSRAEGKRPPPGFHCLWPGSADLVLPPWGR